MEGQELAKGCNGSFDKSRDCALLVSAEIDCLRVAQRRFGDAAHDRSLKLPGAMRTIQRASPSADDR